MRILDDKTKIYVSILWQKKFIPVAPDTILETYVGLTDLKTDELHSIYEYLK